MARISVLRLGHRSSRDERMTTHVCLVARAFGAHEVIISGEPASNVLASVPKLVKKWGNNFPFAGNVPISPEEKSGGSFSVRYERNWKKIAKEAKANGFCIVHLTMKGEPLMERIGHIRMKRDILVVVGSEKVPPEVYGLADYNISITKQPHSEVAALALFLDRFHGGRALGS